MAIPVANPPPSDVPPPPSGGGGYDPPPGGGYGDPGGQGRPPLTSGMSPLVRGCLIAGAFGLFLTCVGGSVLAYSCMGLMDAGTSQLIRSISEAYRASAVRAGEESTHDADLRQLVAISDEGNLSFITFGILNNRYEDARRDGIIDAEELHFGMELIHDIVISNGSVDIERYPNAR
jgi:hypothetical protein